MSGSVKVYPEWKVMHKRGVHKSPCKPLGYDHYRDAALAVSVHTFESTTVFNYLLTVCDSVCSSRCMVFQARHKNNQTSNLPKQVFIPFIPSLEMSWNHVTVTLRSNPKTSGNVLRIQDHMISQPSKRGNRHKEACFHNLPIDRVAGESQGMMLNVFQGLTVSTRITLR